MASQIRRPSNFRIAIIVLAWWYTSYCFALNIKAWYSQRIATKDGLLLCTTAFAAGLLGLLPCLLYLKLHDGPLVLDVVGKLTQFNLDNVIKVTVLGCLAQISTFFLYSTASVHTVQFLRCASPIFAAVAAVSTQEDTMSFGTICSLVSIIIGMGLAAWKDHSFTMSSVGLGITINVMITIRNTGVKQIVKGFDPGTKSTVSVLLMVSSYSMGLALSAVCYVLLENKVCDHLLLVMDMSTLKVAAFSLTYNMLSYLALNEVGLITHSLFEQGKRFFVIILSCMSGDQCPETSFVFWLGLFITASGGVSYLSFKHHATISLEGFAKCYPFHTRHVSKKALFMHVISLALLGAFKYNLDHGKFLETTFYSTDTRTTAGFKGRIFSVHRMDQKNIGDMLSSPLNFFPELRDVTTAVFDVNQDAQHNIAEYNVTKADLIIIGGGGLLNAFDNWTNNIFHYCTSSSCILWSPGYNLQNGKTVQAWPNASSIASASKTVALRDFFLDSDYPYSSMLDASCLHESFDNNCNTTRQVGFYLHSNHRDIHIPKELTNYETMFNDETDEAKVFDFLCSSGSVVTSSYHGILWSTYMNKTVWKTNPHSEKFEHLPFTLPFWPGTPHKTDGTKLRDICRRQNKEFYEQNLLPLVKFLKTTRNASHVEERVLHV